MTKVVRAFSLDPSVSEDLDYYTRVPGVSKPMNKSKYVNEALQFYMGKNIKEMIEENKTLKQNLTAGLRARDLSIGGLEQQVAQLSDHNGELNDNIDDLQKHIRSLETKIKELNQRGLWFHLKRLLKK